MAFTSRSFLGSVALNGIKHTSYRRIKLLGVSARTGTFEGSEYRCNCSSRWAYTTASHAKVVTNIFCYFLVFISWTYLKEVKYIPTLGTDACSWGQELVHYFFKVTNIAISVVLNIAGKLLVVSELQQQKRDVLEENWETTVRVSLTLRTSSNSIRRTARLRHAISCWKQYKTHIMVKKDGQDTTTNYCLAQKYN